MQAIRCTIVSISAQIRAFSLMGLGGDNLRSFRLASRLSIAAIATIFAGSAHAITFDLVFAAGTSAQAQGGFVAAANSWAALFNDPITIRLDVGTQSMGGSVLGFASSNSSSKSYTTVRNAMIGDQLGADDIQAVSTLAAGSTFMAQTNRFTDNPAGAGSLSLFTASLTNLDVNTANQKALGIFTGSAASFDAQIRFNSDFAFDYDTSDGFAAGAFDFVGIAVHEIGHALGFVSGVDYVDSNSSAGDSSTQFAWANTLDLFRYSAAGVRHLGAGTEAKYFSIDSGATGQAALFSLGTQRGDGRQASHWKDSLGIGIMDPTFAPEQLGIITANDIRAMDVIGYNRAPVPEPASLAALGLGALALLRRRKKSA